MDVWDGGEWSRRSAAAPSDRPPAPPADEKGKFDEEVEAHGVRILVDGKSLMHVIGTQMDFVTDRLRSEFVFTNPNSKGMCGCGESFNV